MSAAIVQKSNTTTTTKTSSNTAIYFDCGDIFTTVSYLLNSYESIGIHINMATTVTNAKVYKEKKKTLKKSIS